MLLPYFIFFIFIFHHSRLPGWIRSMIPNIFYITEKAWNYYPYTETGKVFFCITWVSVIHFLFLFMLTFSHFFHILFFSCKTAESNRTNWIDRAATIAIIWQFDLIDTIDSLVEDLCNIFTGSAKKMFRTYTCNCKSSNTISVYHQ
jgi:hypothetical protein